VGDRTRAIRWWLALAYALVTVLAQGLHDHGSAAADAGAAAESACREGRPHAERARPSAGMRGVEDCLACQYRAEPHDAPPVPLFATPEPTAPGCPGAAASSPPLPRPRPSSRGPPPA
jgi:hypothetical protein